MGLTQLIERLANPAAYSYPVKVGFVVILKPPADGLSMGRCPSIGARGQGGSEVARSIYARE